MGIIKQGADCLGASGRLGVIFRHHSTSQPFKAHRPAPSEHSSMTLPGWWPLAGMSSETLMTCLSGLLLRFIVEKKPLPVEDS